MFVQVKQLEKALKWANEVVEYIQLLGPAYHDIWAISDLFQVAQVHYRMDEEKFSQDVELLESMAPFHPLALRACRRLGRLRAQWELVKDNPEALVLTPFAVSSTVEISNETDEVLVPFPGLAQPAHLERHGVPLSVYFNPQVTLFKQPYLQFNKMFQSTQNRFEELPTTAEILPPMPSSSTATTPFVSSVGIVDMATTMGHAAEIEAATEQHDFDEAVALFGDLGPADGFLGQSFG